MYGYRSREEFQAGEKDRLPADTPKWAREDLVAQCARRLARRIEMQLRRKLLNSRSLMASEIALTFHHQEQKRISR